MEKSRPHQKSARYAQRKPADDSRSSASPSPTDLLRLQRTIGNHAVSQLVASGAASVQRRFADRDMPEGVELSAVVQARLADAIVAMTPGAPSDLHAKVTAAVQDSALHSLPSWLLANGLPLRAEDVIRRATELGGGSTLTEPAAPGEQRTEVSGPELPGTKHPGAEVDSVATAPAPGAWLVEKPDEPFGKLVETGGGGRTAIWLTRESAVKKFGNRWLFGANNPLETRQGVKFVIMLPPGMAAAERPKLAAARGVQIDEVLFTNTGDPKLANPFKGQGDNARRISQTNQARALAHETITRYLTTLGFGDIGGAPVEQWLTKASVTSMANPQVFAGGGVIDPANVEADTSPADRGQRHIRLNENNHTWGTLVHELFHVLEHSSIMNFSFDNPIGYDLQEGITEYLTAEATGCEVRTDHAKQATMYLRATEFVRGEVGGGFISLADLADVFFNGIAGRREAADKLAKRWGEARG